MANLAASGSRECQLCVSDNASTDGTMKMLEHYASRHEHIKYGRNAENLGFGRNLYSAARLADGDFVYFCGDDDLLRKDSLPLLLAFAKSKSDLVLFNSCPGAKVKKSGFAAGQIMNMANAADYFRRLGIFHGSFIGNLFFHRESFLGVDAGAALSLSAYPHMVPVLKMLGRGGVLFVNEPVVDYTDSQRFWKPLQPIYTAIDMVRLITENVDWTGARWLKQSVYGRLIRSLPKAICSSKSNQIPDFSNNPYGSVSRENILQVYKPASCFALIGGTLALVMSCIAAGRGRQYETRNKQLSCY